MIRKPRMILALAAALSVFPAVAPALGHHAIGKPDAQRLSVRSFMIPPGVRIATMRRVDWYFDFVSPYAYLCLHRLGELPSDIGINYRPVLFAGLLSHWGQKGPAEIVPKRRYTYRSTHWQAKLQGVPFRYPAAHPFNPLHHLRLAIAAGSGAAAVRRIFDSVWTGGGDAADPAAFAALAKDIGVEAAKLSAPEVKDALRRNTEEAAARGVFGVPTLAVDGELFWGSDSIGYLKAFLADPAFVHNAEIDRLDALPAGAARKPA